MFYYEIIESQCYVASNGKKKKKVKKKRRRAVGGTEYMSSRGSNCSTVDLQSPTRQHHPMTAPITNRNSPKKAGEDLNMLSGF